MPPQTDITKLSPPAPVLWRGLMSRLYYLLSEGHRYFGNTYNRKSEQEKAIRALNRAVMCNPQYARAYMERGILYWREIDAPRQAISDLTIAYELDPTLIEARFNRGIAHQQLREYGQAITDFRAYLVEGQHPYWREYAQTMIRELEQWVSEHQDGGV